MMTRRDPYVNMLRNTIAVVAAGLGGADAITMLPHTVPLGLPTHSPGASRATRSLSCWKNPTWRVSAILPRAPVRSKRITQQLCAAAWTQFQEIESRVAPGRRWNAVLSRVTPRRFAPSAKKPSRARKDILTGTNAYPDLHEAPPVVLDVAPRNVPKDSAAQRGARRRCRGSGSRSRSNSCATAPTPFSAETGARPKIFLANARHGSRDFTARATFAKSFFEAGGIEAVAGDGSASLDEMSAAFKASGARLACLCSSDEVYAREGDRPPQALSRP